MQPALLGIKSTMGFYSAQPAPSGDRTALEPSNHSQQCSTSQDNVMVLEHPIQVSKNSLIHTKIKINKVIQGRFFRSVFPSRDCTFKSHLPIIRLHFSRTHYSITQIHRFSPPSSSRSRLPLGTSSPKRLWQYNPHPSSSFTQILLITATLPFCLPVLVDSPFSTWY